MLFLPAKADKTGQRIRHFQVFDFADKPTPTIFDFSTSFCESQYILLKYNRI